MENGGKARLRSNKKDDKREEKGIEEVSEMKSILGMKRFGISKASAIQ